MENNLLKHIESGLFTVMATFILLYISQFDSLSFEVICDALLWGILIAITQEILKFSWNIYHRRIND